MEFPYGKAPLCIMLIAGCSALALFVTGRGFDKGKPDLVFLLFAEPQLRAYQQIVPEFERQYGVKVQMQVVQIQSLQSRLAAAMLSGAELPDLVELLAGSMGFFTKGPLEEVGFTDLTERIRAEGLDQRLVASRFSLWSSRGHIFGLPHDVHPVVLAYNRGLVKELGIDVNAIETWDDFAAMGRKITADLDGDGTIDRFAIDMIADGGDHLDLLIRQRGASLFDETGKLTLYDPVIVDTVCWYIRQTRGKTRIAFPAGWGQSLAKAMLDDFVVFFFAPDWRTKSFELDIPKMNGRLGLMPLPAWEKGGRRTSTWGGSGLCITKACKNQELAWEFAKFLYFNKDMLGKNFRNQNILPPLKETWDMPELKEPNPFYGGQSIGSLFVELAPQAPPTNMNPYFSDALWKLNETFIEGCLYYEKQGEEGLQEHVDATLKERAQALQKLIDYNLFYRTEEAPPTGSANQG